MVWPHHSLFPYRHTVFKVGCAVGAGGAFLWPGLTSGQRLLTLVAAFYGVASGFLTYGIVLLLLRVIPILHRLFAFILFYGALALIATALFQAGHALIVDDPFDAAQRALEFAAGLCGAFGVSAAAYGAINRTVSPRRAAQLDR